MPLTQSDDVAALARQLGPQIRAVREEAEDLRQTPSALADALAKAGLYQMYLPRSAGGPEMAPPIAFSAIEELSKADGSVGWNAMIASVLSFFTGWLTPDVTRGMCGDPADLRMAGSLRPQGGAWPVDRRLPCQRTVEFRQRHSECQLAPLHLHGHGWRQARTHGGGHAEGSGDVGSGCGGDHQGYMVGHWHARNRQSGFHGR